MSFGSLLHELRPGREDDPKLREYLDGLGHSSLQMLGLIEIAAPVVMHIGGMAVHPALETQAPWPAAAMALTGALTLLASRLAWSRRHGRLLAALSVWMATALLIGAHLWINAGLTGSALYVPGVVAIVALTAASTAPFRPMHVLALGLAIEGAYALAAWLWRDGTAPGSHHVFLLMLALLATAIAAANYGRRRLEFESHQEALRVTEALAGAQLRAQLAENAISIGKMAAAVTHEINSPLGALRSSISTLCSVCERLAAGPAEQRERLLKLRDSLQQSIEESASRIDDVVVRLQRFVNLDEAEMKAADINDLLTDVTLLHHQELETGHIRLDFDLEKPLPELICRPQLLSVVFSSLLSNAIRAVDGDGRICIRTRRLDGSVEVTIRDDGRGMSAEEVENIFDPSFKVAQNRVASGNWSLFNTRQIVYEHGGEISIESAEGSGTAFHVTLPLA